MEVAELRTMSSTSMGVLSIIKTLKDVVIYHVFFVYLRSTFNVINFNYFNYRFNYYHFLFCREKWDYRKAIYISDISAATPVANIQKFTTENPSRYILYVGRFSCPDCRAFSATFKRLMGKYPALDFYYYDTDKIRENKVLYHEEDSFLNDVLHVSHVPSLLLMENGEKINVFTETEITESSFDYMVNNDEQ